MLLTLLGCGTENLAQAWQIDRLRILGVAAEPAEPRPGDFVTFSALTVSPKVPIAATVWTICADATSDQFGCGGGADSLDLGSDPENFDFEAFAAAGGIGIEPFLPPTWTVPGTLLDALNEQEKLEGTTALVNLVSVPDQKEVDEDDVEIAFKRVPVSLAVTPNHNPTLTGWRVDGNEVAASAVVSLKRGQTYDIEPILAADAVEDYVYRTKAGTDEDRTEEPYFSWYLEEGMFDQANSLYPEVAVEYTVPTKPEADTGTVWTVMRDRRGGMAWLTLTLRYE